MQLLRDHAKDYCEEIGLTATSQELAECLVDHDDIPGDQFGYFGLNSKLGRERFSRHAVCITWQVLSTDRGARRRPDTTAIRNAQRALEQRKRNLLELQDNHDEALQVPPCPEKVTVEDLWRLGERQARAQQLAVEERRVSAAVRELELEIQALKVDRRRWAEIPDDVEPGNVPPVREALLQLDQPDRWGRPERRREYLTVAEIARIKGVGCATARRWCNGETLPHPDGDPRNPWDSGQIPIDDSLGVKRRRILVDRLKPAFFGSESERRLRDELLAQWPQGWSREHARAPLDLDCGYADHQDDSSGAQDLTARLQDA